MEDLRASSGQKLTKVRIVLLLETRITGHLISVELFPEPVPKSSYGLTSAKQTLGPQQTPKPNWQAFKSAVAVPRKRKNNNSTLAQAVQGFKNLIGGESKAAKKGKSACLSGTENKLMCPKAAYCNLCCNAS